MNFRLKETTDTTAIIEWTHGECPTQDEVRDYLNATSKGDLKPELTFDPKVTGFPFGKSLMFQKYVRGGHISDEIFDMGVTAVYEWFLFDRYSTNMCCSFTPHYECHFIYTTYDVDGKYQNQTPGFAKKFPKIAAAEEKEWEELRDKIEEWLAETWRESGGISYFVAASIDRYTMPQREDFWPESISDGLKTEMSMVRASVRGDHRKRALRLEEKREEDRKEQRRILRKEHLEKELEHERCNSSKG